MPTTIYCPHCGIRLAIADNIMGNMVKCPSCKNDFNYQIMLPLAKPISPNEIANQEKVYLEEDNVLVTNSRIVCSGITYSVSTVTGVMLIKNDKQKKDAAGWACGFICAASMGICCPLPYNIWTILGFGTLACFAIKAARQNMWLVSFSSGTNQFTITTPNLEQANRIIAAINQAIANR